MNILKTILIAIVGTMLFACTPDPIDIDLPEAEQKLVISSQVIPNSVMIVTVSKSFSALKSTEGDSVDTEALMKELLVENAQVSISYNGVTDTLFKLTDVPGVYFSIGTPQYINTEYVLNVFDPETGLRVDSRATMLDRVWIDDVQAERKVIDGSNVVDINLSFQDPPATKNYYMVNVYQVDQDNSASPDFFSQTDESSVTFLLDDANFDGPDFVGESRIHGWNSDTIAVSLSNISKEYYEYLEVRKKSGGLFSQLTSEPINYPTNVNGGYGFFTTHFPDAKIIVLTSPSK